MGPVHLGLDLQLLGLRSTAILVVFPSHARAAHRARRDQGTARGHREELHPAHLPCGLGCVVDDVLHSLQCVRQRGGCQVGVRMMHFGKQCYRPHRSHRSHRSHCGPTVVPLTLSSVMKRTLTVLVERSRSGCLIRTSSFANDT